jgi:integrase
MKTCGLSRLATGPRIQARERFIMPGDEFERFAEAVNEEPKELFRDFFWMCLFAGARKSNILAMEWDQIDLNLMTWRIPITKNGSPQTIPLTPNAMALLERRLEADDKDEQWVFPADRASSKTGERGHLIDPKKAWARILERAQIKDLRIHDLRRTAGSYMAIKGVSVAIIGKALGHRSPNSTAIYARLTEVPARQALEQAQAAMTDLSQLLRCRNWPELPNQRLVSGAG